jgi:hypothetical protein
MTTAIHGWRAHALDGAVLWFQPGTGLHVRWDGPATRAVRRRAPRVVMFGITNRCNLTCSFCSRDAAAPSRWTSDSAFDILAGLAAAGTLEVAFGGGEPLSFRGFDALVARLRAETPLAVHVTTNGTFLHGERLRRLRPLLGEIRVSIYDDNPWQERIAALAALDGPFGANLLVTPARLPAVPALLDRLAALGCPEVSLLSYVGPDPALHLGADGDRQLAAIATASPIRARVSVCLGDRLDPAPRLFATGDCGAGRDFVSIGPDGSLRACSFGGAAVSVATAADVLAAWADRQEELARPVAATGCARGRDVAAAALDDGLRVWRGFSGNNSGECILVGRFAEAYAASRFVERLMPGFAPERPMAPEWRALLAESGIDVEAGEHMPEALVASGRTVIAYTSVTPGDDFPSLRQLLWARGGRPVAQAVHAHGRARLLAGLETTEARDGDDLFTALALDPELEVDRRGSVAYARTDFTLHGERSLAAVTAQLAATASAHGAALSVDLVPATDEANPSPLAADLGAPAPAVAPVERLWLRFASDDDARRATRRINGRVTVAGRHALVEASVIPARLVLGLAPRPQELDLLVEARVRVAAHLWRPDQTALDPRAVASLLRLRLAGDDVIETHSAWTGAVVAVTTDEPARALTALVEQAAAYGLEALLTVEPPRPTVSALARIDAELRLEALARR